MRVRSVVVAGALGVVAVASFFHSGRSQSDPIAMVRGDDPQMLAAFARAQAGWPDFVAAYRRPPAGSRSFAVKVPLAATPDGKGYSVVQPGPHPGATVEYFWVRNLVIEGDTVRGVLDNDGDMVTAARVGQNVAFVRNQVADWLYVQNGRMIGNATMCPELRTLPEAQRKALLEKVGASCA